MTFKRSDYIDIAKGLGMLAVVWAHIMIDGPTAVIAYGFDIPLFFFLSGLVFNNEKYKDFRTFVKSRVKNLLIPYIFFFIITFAAWAAFCIITHYETKSFSDVFFELFLSHGSGEFIPQNPPLWFVPCLFAVEIIYYAFCKAHDAVKIIISIVLASIGYFLIIPNSFFDFKSNLPWSIEGAFRAVIFYTAGNITASHLKINGLTKVIVSRKTLSTIIMLLCLCAFVPLALFNGQVSVGSNEYGKSNILFYITGFIGTAAAIIFACKTESFDKSRNLKVINNLKWIGRNSFFFMAIHYPVHTITNMVTITFGNIIGYDFLQSTASNYYLCIISFILTMIITSVAAVVYTRIKAKIKTKTAT